MPEEQPPNTDTSDETSAVSDSAIADGVRAMISTTLDIGASMAKMVAEATSGGRSVASPPNQDPVNAIVHYSVVSVVNVVSTVASSASQARPAAAPQSPASPPGEAQTTAATPPADSQQSNQPTVHRGAALRIPLSIENPGAEPMTDISFVCLEIRLLERTSSGGDYSSAWVRFEPQSLTIAPNDFEKLTVFIDVPKDAALGHYQTSIGMDSNTPIAVINFTVFEQIQ